MASEGEQFVSRGRYTVIPRTLVFLRNGDDILLLKGAPTKRLWAGRYNGLGGHVEADETIMAGALREVREEAGLDADAIDRLLPPRADQYRGGAAWGVALRIHGLDIDARRSGLRRRNAGMAPGVAHWPISISLTTIGCCRACCMRRESCSGIRATTRRVRSQISCLNSAG